MAFLLFCDATEDDAWAHTIGSGITSGLVIHRGECGGGVDSTLSSVVKALLHDAEERESEPVITHEPKTTGFVN